MHVVELIFEGITNVWMTEEVVDGILEHDPTGALLAKIRYFAAAGFRHHEGSKGRPIRPEGSGVVRIGYGDLFRVYGFYTDDIRGEFIAIRAHTKRKKKNTSRERRVIDEVAEVKHDGTWTKAESEEES